MVRARGCSNGYKRWVGELHACRACRGHEDKNTDSCSGVSVQKIKGLSPSRDTCVPERDTLL